jgi:copper chaperone NosL
MRPAAALGLFALAFGCASGPPEPAPLDTRNEACATCRMAVSEARFAAQIVAPGELPRFFDDLGCLAAYLRAGRAPGDAAVFVADHRTRAWVRAESAVFTRVPALATPMGSHLVAHADAASRDADAAAGGGAPAALGDVSEAR